MENVDFHNFLDRMRNPDAADLVRSIKSFIVSFSSGTPDPEKDSDSVQEFMTTMENTFKVHRLWAGATDEEIDSAAEGLEKYLMTKLFNRAFSPLPEDIEREQKLSEKISLLQQFIRPEHLDIPSNFQNETSWLLAQKELQKINSYKAPRDKIICILNCCRIINNLLLNVSMSANDNPPGADDFLPVLIYVTIKANPPQLNTNLLYIQRYRHQSRLVSEAAYFYTNLVSAVSFIESISATSLSMDEHDYEEKMAAAMATLESANSYETPPLSLSMDQKGLDLSSSTSTDTVKPQSVAHVSSTDTVEKGKVIDPVRELVAKGSPSVLEADRTGRLAREYPFLYARAGNLRVEEVETLLNEYKELAVRYYALTKALEESNITAYSRDFSKTTSVNNAQTIMQTDTTVEVLAHVQDKVQNEFAGSLQEGIKIESPPADSETEHAESVDKSLSKGTEKGHKKDSVEAGNGAEEDIKDSEGSVLKLFENLEMESHKA